MCNKQRVIVLLVFGSFVNSARILGVFPTPAFSHQLFYGIIYRELSLRGHQVTVFTPNPFEDRRLTNLTEISLNSFYTYANQVDFEKIMQMYKIEMNYRIQKVYSELADQVFSHAEMQKLTESSRKHFDLVLVEWNVNPSYSVLSKIFNCPLVGIRSLGLRLEGHDSVGNPTNPSYIRIAYTDLESSFLGKVNQFILSLLWRLSHYLVTVPEARNLVRKHFPNVNDDILDIEKNVSIVLTNTHPVYNRPRPLVPSVIEVGGIHLGQERKNISRDLQTYLDEGITGIIYFNLGSLVKFTALENHTKDVIIGGLSGLPYKVIMKYESENFENIPKNVKTWKWLPQQEILRHANVKLFISHTGLHSFQEAIYYQQPIIGIPLLADQFATADRIVELGIGERLNLKIMTKETFISTVEGVLRNPEYKKKLKEISALVEDQPMKPLDKAIWWIEYVLRHGGTPYFKTAAVDMSWFEYLLIDVIVFLMTCVFVCCFVVCYVLIYIKRTVRRLQSSTKKKSL